MLDLVKASKYAGFIGVEYEGEIDAEIEGIKNQGTDREKMVK